jgi:FG-GAP-like repeat
MKSWVKFWNLRALALGLLVCSMMAATASAQFQFSAPANYPVGVAPSNVAVGDFNGDGKQDFVVANSGTGNVSILLGNGDGTFQQAVDFTAGNPVTFVAVGDFNRDGKPDLAVANGSANEISILLGKGDGTFELPSQNKTGIAADYVAVADFNNDNRPDLFVSAGGNIGILLGNGDGTFQNPILTTTPGRTSYFAIGDFNGDGKLDVATGNAAVYPYATHGSVFVLFGNGDGTFQSPVTSAVGFMPVYLTAADFNKDGKTDLAIVGAQYAVNQLHQLCVSEGVFTLLGNGNGTFNLSASEYLPRASCWYPPPPQNPYAPNLAVADLNDDGKLDLVVPVVVPKPSIFGGHQATAVWVFVGNGNGTFAGPQFFSLTATPDWLSVGEFKAGTLPSLVLSNSSTNNISVLLNKTP